MRKILLLAVLLVCAFITRAQVDGKDQSAAMQLVNANKAKLGLSSDDISNLMVQSSYIIQGTNIRMAYMQQTYKGIPVYNKMLVLAFQNGNVVSQAGQLMGSMESRTNNHSGMPAVKVDQALATALTDRKIGYATIAEPVPQAGADRLVFGKMGIAHENITAELMWIPTSVDEKQYQLTWQFFIAPNKSSDYWLVRINSDNNTVAGTENLTVYCNWSAEGHSANEHYQKHAGSNGVADLAKTVTNNFVANKQQQKSFDWQYRPFVVNSGVYRVVRYPAESPLHPGGTPATHTNPWTWAPGNATTLKWHDDGTGDANDTKGNNVLASEDLDGNNVPGLLAVSTTALPDLTFNFTPDFTQPPTQTSPVPNQQFNITNLFYWNNLMHDLTYLYGFDEPSGNFQQTNLGRGGLGNDRVNADAQNPGNCNANFATPVDGTSGRMQMFLCTNTTPPRDGDADNAVIAHEYAHGISNRLTGGPGNSSCLGNSEQMGEGWSDYFGLMYTADWATATASDGFNNPRGMGTYLFGQAPNGPGIRPTRYSTNFAVNPTTYANLPGQAIPHGVGYVWCTMLWEMTWEIIQTAGINPNLFQVTPSITGGNNIALKLVVEGMRLQPCNPGFVQGRDAILRADTLFFGAQYSCAILRAFARRGLGLGASQGSSGSITDGVPSFNGGGPTHTLSANVTAQQQLNDIIYTQNITANCEAIVNYTLTDTLPTHVTFVSATAGGTYNAGNRVVSWPVNVAVNATNQYQFTVNINNGSYFPPVDHINDPVLVAPIPATWTAATTNVASNWTVSSAQSASAPNSYFVNNVATVADVTLRTTNQFLLPAGASAFNEFRFTHRIQSENGFDGGVVEISTNGGGSWSDLGPYIIQNGYNGVLSTAFANPIGGRNAFTGTAAGFATTIVNLNAFAGQNVMIRFRFGSDNSISATGWFVDDIMVSSKPVVIMNSNLYNAANVLQTTRQNIVEIIPACTPPVVTTQPQSNILCNNGNAVFTVAVTGFGLTYQWELSTDNGATWNPITGATTPNYVITGATSALNGRRYRVQINSACGATTSNEATIYVSPALTHSSVTANPATVCVPAPSIISGTANGGTVGAGITLATSGNINQPIPDNTPAGFSSSITSPAITFNQAANLKVQVVTTNGHTWAGDLILRLTSPCGNTFLLHRPGVPQSTFGNSNDFNGTYVFDLAGATIVSETGAIPPGTYQPSNDANPGVAHPWTGITFPCSGAGTWTLNVSDNAGGDVGTLVSWSLIIGGGYTHTLTGPGTIVQNAPSGANNQTGSFTVTNAPVGVNNYTFTSTDALGCSVSTVVTLTTSAPPVITVQPVARVICQGASTTFNVTATGLNLTYQWQLSTDVGATWANIPGATANTTAVNGAALSQSGHQYRVIVTSACGSVTSNAVTLTVTPNPIHQNLGATPNPVCEPGPVALTGTAVGGTLSGGADIVLASSGVINLAIPDAGAAVTNNITVPAFTFNAAANLKVRVNIGHTWVGDISVRLTTPCGNTIVFDRPGVPASAFGNSANLSGVYIFDIGAATIIPEVLGAATIPAGSYIPSDVPGAAHTWTGMTFPCSGAGTWTISLQDFVGGDVGTLTEWAILGPSAVGQYTHTMTGPGTIVQNPSTGGPSNPTANFTASNLTAGTLVYNLTTTDSRGCSTTSPINVTVNPRPNPVIVSNNMTQRTVTFNSTGVTTINAVGAATPYPSVISVSGVPATATVASVTLNGVSHTFPSDIDALLQSPNGTNVVLMSDAGSGTDIVNVNYTFQDGAPAMNTTVNPSGTYSPTNVGATDAYPAPVGSVTQATPTLASLAPGLVHNGDWKLYVVDDLGGDAGSINSWSITFTYPVIDLCLGSSTQLAVLDTTATRTSTTPITIPALGNGSPYPGTLVISGLPNFARVRSVTLNGLSHTFPADIDILLQSPNGTNVILMSDVGGGNAINNVNYTFMDGFPALGTGANPTGTYRPTNTAGPDNFPAPGPGNVTIVNPTIASFNTSALTPNGTWNLFAVDDLGGDQGSITSWSITFDVPGATSITYTWSPATGLSSTTGNPVTASPTSNITYTVNAVSNFGCTSAAPASIAVNILQLPAITVQPTPATQTICPGYNVIYTVTATGDGLTYQWRKNGVNMVNGGNVSGATSATLTLTSVTAADAGTYTVVVSGTCPPAVTSNPAVLQIGTLPTITTQPPATTTVCQRYSTTISVVATALPPIQIYQWQVSTDGVTWTNLANSAPGSSPFYNNVFSATLTIGNAPLSISGNRYRVVITTNCGFVINSNASVLTVNPTPTVTATPVTQRVCISDTLVLLSGSPAGGVWSGPGVVPGTNQFLPYNTAVGVQTVKYKVTNQPSGCADSALVTINVEACPERIRTLPNGGVLLYPNPNNGQFNIRVNSTLYNYLGMKVFTSAGALVKHQRWSNLPYGRVLPIDLRDLAAAVYIVYIYYEDGVRTSETSFKVIIASH